MDKIKVMTISREQAIDMLWGMSSDANGLELIAERRAKIVQKLRGLADLIERAPQNVVSLVLIAGEKSFGDEKSAISDVTITGTAPAIAASFCVFEEIGRSALNEMLPHVLSEVIADTAAEDAELTDIKVN